MLTVEYYQVALLLILTLTEACQPPPCHWSNSKPMADYFEELANTLIAADRRAQQFCYNYGGRSSKEIFGNQFRYVFPVGKYRSGDFTVKIKNRLLFIHGNSCERIFAEVRLVPDFLDVYHATWTYQNEEIVVSLPYLYQKSVGRLYKSCYPHDPSVITVQKEDNNEVDRS